MRTPLCAVRFTPALLFFAFTATLTPAAIAQAQVPEAGPALLPGEVFALTQNGCGIVTNTGGSDMIQTVEFQPDGSQESVWFQVEDYVATQVWTGDCSGGLAQGWGKYGPPGAEGIEMEFWPEGEFAYGRDLRRFRSLGDEITYVVGEGDDVQVVRLKGLGDNGTGLPQWSAEEFDVLGGSNASSQQISVRTKATTCYIDAEKFRGCRGDGYPVYGVTVQTFGEGGEAIDHWCPNPKSTKGCEELWEELAGPTLTQARAQIEQWEQRTQAAVQQYADISAPWLAQEPERAAARQEAQLVARAAEAQAQADAEQLRKVQAQEAAAAFEEQLAAANPGELFILSQDLDAEGRSEEARLARRALITRFPDNALAATAAQQMMATPAPTAASSAAPTAAPSADFSAGLYEPDSYEDEGSSIADALSVFADTLEQMAGSEQGAADYSYDDSTYDDSTYEDSDYQSEPDYSDNSRVIAGNGVSAMDCAQLVQVAPGNSRVSGGGTLIVNNCGESIEITWCYVGEGDGCGAGGLWTLRAGGSWPVDSGKEVRWAACRGRNSVEFERGSQGLRYICNEPY